jgi:hypothetical protein
MDRDTGALCIEMQTQPVYSLHSILFNIPMYTQLPVSAIHLVLHPTYTIYYLTYHYRLT